MDNQPTNSVIDAIERLRSHIVSVPLQLTGLSIEMLTQKAPGKWSRQEMIGHLIDSAVNNLKRFTEAQFANGPYQLEIYNQDQLVLVNRYQALSLPHLLTLWQSLNTQIIYVVEAIPTRTLNRPIRLSVPATTDHTLGWLIEDYVVHLEHHLKTLLA